MLHRTPEIIQPETFDLLERLQSDEMLADFFLVEAVQKPFKQF